jgi:hypothetical protein
VTVPVGRERLREEYTAAAATRRFATTTGVAAMIDP